jgi:hypothetical protein
VSVERASELDRAFFEEHPDDDVYYRDRVPGEWGPYEGEIASSYTKVTQVSPGARLREPVEIVWAKEPAGDGRDVVIDPGWSMS